MAQQAGREGRRLVVEGVRRAIISGDVVPGQRLVEAQLAERFGASRGAVREALQDLAADLLVELTPGKGARIRVVRIDEAIQITECRIALEVLCARRASDACTDAQAEQLSAVVEELRTAVAESRFGDYSDMNHRLHRLIADISGQGVAARLLDRLSAQMVRYQYRLSFHAGRPQQSLGEHTAIAEAVVAHDADAAEAAVRAHLSSVIEEIRQSPEPVVF